MSRKGYTLLEISLVLAILVAVAGMAIPSFQGQLADRRLRSAADHVRAAWLNARSSAMTSGQIFMFRYTAESNEFSVSAWEGADAGVESSSSSSAGVTGEISVLPEGVMFVGGQQQDDLRGQQVLTEMGAAGGNAPPVLFYADGQTSTVELQLAHEYGQGVTLSIRGLTGVVTTSDLYPLEAR